MNTVKVILTPDLLELNRRAVKAKRNRAFRDDIVNLLDPEGVHIVAWSMIHNDMEVRAMLMMKFKDDDEPHQGYLDMAIEDFNKLEVVDA